MKKTLLAMALAFCMLLPLASCGGGETGTPAVTGGNNAAAETDAAETEPEETTEPRPALELPETDYDGYDFRFLTYELGTVDGGYVQCQNYTDLYAESENGEAINDAIYARNRAVEEKLNITLTNSFISTNMTSMISASVSAGSDDFDAALSMIRASQKIASEGILVNLYTIDTISPDKPWWDTFIQEDVAINNCLYILTGDATLQDKQGMVVIAYNTDLADRMGLEPITDAVWNGEWTFDMMTAQLSAVTADLDGDGKVDQGDQYGMGTNYTSAYFFLAGMGGSFAYLEDGVPKSGLGDERAANCMEKIGTMMNDATMCTISDKITGGWTTIREDFIAGKVLIRSGQLYSMNALRETVDDFTLIPNPKYDETQDNYYVPTSPHASTGFTVPVTNSDLDRTGAVLETMNYYSSDTVRYAFYDVTLSGKLIRDEASEKMLDLLLSNMSYDIGYVFDWAGITAKITGSVKKGGGTFASDYASVSAQYEAEMADTYALYQ